MLFRLDALMSASKRVTGCSVACGFYLDFHDLRHLTNVSRSRFSATLRVASSVYVPPSQNAGDDERCHRDATSQTQSPSVVEQSRPLRCAAPTVADCRCTE